jgi:diguanylate cyclase (GGDEF)-like protein/PAS domain S-box-containing protein
MDTASSFPAQRPNTGPGPALGAVAVGEPISAGATRFRSLSDPESLREFARNLREGIYISSLDGRLLDANPAFLEMCGVASISELGEFGASSLFADPSRRTEQLALLEAHGSVREFEITIVRPDAALRTALDTCYLIRDPDTGEAFIHGILIDITSRKQLEADLVEMSTRDVLTGALNRHYLMKMEERIEREPESRFGCIFVDIDHFKIYNDRFGHAEGDEVLKRMARFLMRYVRAEEAVLRIGGDEFVVILHDADAGETERVADRFRAEALKHAPVPFSLGWASREKGESLQRVLDRADLGLMQVRVVMRHTDPRQQRAQKR